MLRVVRTEERAHSALAAERGDGAKQPRLVAEVEVGLRLVEDEQLGLGGESAREDDELIFAAAYAAAKPARKLRNPRELERRARLTLVLRGGRGECSHAGQPPEQNHFHNRVDEGRGPRLRHVAHAAAELARRQAANVGAVEERRPLAPRAQPRGAAESVVFPAPFAPSIESRSPLSRLKFTPRST